MLAGLGALATRSSLEGKLALNVPPRLYDGASYSGRIMAGQIAGV